jgi:hypothetical protein
VTRSGVESDSALAAPLVSSLAGGAAHGLEAPRGRALCALRVCRREEWQVIVLEAVAGGQGAALGVSPRTLVRWCREIGVARVRGGRRSGSGRKKRAAPIIDTPGVA